MAFLDAARSPRLLFAAATGFFADLFGMGDAYDYSERMHTTHSALLITALAALLIVPAILNFGQRMTFRIPIAVWIGMAIPHTTVLAVEVSRDPTSHNLFPFEYILITAFTIPALSGSLAGGFAGRAWSRGNR